MNINTLTRPLAFGALAVVMAAPAVKAQQQLFSWSGPVDQQVQLTLSGRSVTVSNIGPREVPQRSSRLFMTMPRENGYVAVQMQQGRGNVDVIQQPSAANGFTSIIRIVDPQGGAGNYQLAGYWQASANGEIARNGGPPYGRARGRGQNQGRGQDQDRDQDQDRGRNQQNRNGTVNGTTNGNVYANRTVLQWSGDVDDNLAIRLTPGGVTYRTLRGNDPRGIQASFNGIPQGATRLIVNNVQGRGTVEVLQQPTAQNGYTATVRVLDPPGGYGHYSFNLTWQ